MRHPVPDTVLLSTFLDRAASESAEQTALFDGKESLSFAAVKTEAAKLARTLIAHGVTPGERVFVVMDNCNAFALAFWAAQYAAAVFVPINPTTPAAQLCWLLDDSKPRLMFAQVKNRAAICEALAGAQTAPVVIWSTPDRFEASAAEADDGPLPLADQDGVLIDRDGEITKRMQRLTGELAGLSRALKLAETAT
jgi:acyl-CoA synthetase (AMP-forming)/AMP-acid ligase II